MAIRLAERGVLGKVGVLRWGKGVVGFEGLACAPSELFSDDDGKPRAEARVY